MVEKTLLDTIFSLYDLQADQAYNVFKCFYTERESGASLHSLDFHINYVARLYQDLSHDMAIIEGKKRVENDCYFIDEKRHKNVLESAKLQTVIGFYGMNLLKSCMDERDEKHILSGVISFGTTAGNLGTLVQGSEYTAANLDVTKIVIGSRSYQQIRASVENSVRAKRFDLMKQALDTVRSEYVGAFDFHKK